VITAPRRGEPITDDNGRASLRLSEYLEANADDLNRTVSIVDDLVSNTNEYTTTNVVESRLLNAGTATTSDIANNFNR